MTLRKAFAVLLAVVLALLLAPTASATAADTDGGPGVWGPPAPGGAQRGSAAWRYERQGRPPKHLDEEYWVPFPEVRNRPGFNIKTWRPNNAEGVAYDDYERDTNTLVEKKGPGYANKMKYAFWEAKVRQRSIIGKAERMMRATRGTGAKVRWDFAERAVRDNVKKDLRNLGIESMVQEPESPPVLNAPGSAVDPDGDAVQKGAIPQEKPGGIDFSNLQLNYLSAADTATTHAIRYSFKAGPPAQSGTDNAADAALASDAFFVWLRLDPSQFWVNLNPTQPDKIVGKELGKTVVGQVLLDSDLQLKKTGDALTDPSTPLGRQYWRELLRGPDNDRCASERYWIVPKAASVRATGETLYILDAPLTVKTQHLDATNPRTGKPTCPGQTKEQITYNEALARRLLLPKMIDSVNNDPAYAQLRQVYLSRVAAQWYRHISADRDTLFKPLIDDGWIAPYWPSKPWDPKSVWRKYIKEYDASHGTVVVAGKTYTVVYGGVVFSTAPQTPMAARRFAHEYRSLPTTVDRSITKAAHDPGTKATYAGGITTIPKLRSGSGRKPAIAATGIPLWHDLQIGIGLLLVGALLLGALRCRRTSTT